MALFFMDSFDSYGDPFNEAIMARRYGTVVNGAQYQATTGRFGGKACYIYWDSSAYFGTEGLGITNDTIVAGFGYKMVTAIAAATYPVFAFYDGSTKGMNLRVNSSGKWCVYRGDTLIATDTGASVVPGTWYWIEFKVKCNDTTGTYDLKVNTTTRLSATAQDTKAGSNNYHDGFRFFGGGPGGTSNPAFDDFYLLDGSGSFNTDFLGNHRVITLRPSASGDSTQWTPSAGSNYAAVDEVEADDDTTYVESGTSGHKDLYNYDDLSGVTDVIKGVQSVIDCRETDATTYSIYQPVKSTTESQGSSEVIGTESYTERVRLMEKNPVTTNQWTVAEVNGAQFGIELL